MRFVSGGTMAKSRVRTSQQAQESAGEGPMPMGASVGRGNGFAAAALGRASGASLPFRSEMELLYGADFSGLSVGVGIAEAEMAGAHALTDGQSIAFADSSPDRETVAHELAHVMQHGNGGGGGSALSTPGDASEQEAHSAADAALRGETPTIRRTAGAGVHGHWFGVGGAPQCATPETESSTESSGSWMSDRWGDLTNSRPDEDRLDAEEDMRAFMARTYSDAHFQPKTGRGNFDAHYDPSCGVLTIHVGVHFDFQNGDPADAMFVGGGHPASAFEWTDPEKEAYTANAIAAVVRTWQGQYTFHNTTPYWESVPDVNVVIDVTPNAEGDSHYSIEVFKWPHDGKGAHIDRPGKKMDDDCAAHRTINPYHGVGGEFHESLDDGGMGGPDVSHFTTGTGDHTKYAEADAANPGIILFDQDSAAVEASDKALLKTFGQTLGLAYIPPFEITVEGHASSEGRAKYNQALSEERANNVAAEISGGGSKTTPKATGLGETGATPTENWRYAEIEVGNYKESQMTVLHEFGHIFGLADEYPKADGASSRQVGDEVDHSDLSEELIPGQGPVVATDDERIMSNGEVVMPHHYVTFLEVLGTMTKTTGQWAIGPGPGSNLTCPSE
jgi:hypothetical protein